MAGPRRRALSPAPLATRPRILHRCGRLGGKRLSNARECVSTALAGPVRHARVSGGRIFGSVLLAVTRIRKSGAERVAGGRGLRDAVHSRCGHRQRAGSLRRIRNRARKKALSVIRSREPFRGAADFRGLGIHRNWRAGAAHGRTTLEVCAMVVCVVRDRQRGDRLADVSVLALDGNQRTMGRGASEEP